MSLHKNILKSVAGKSILMISAYALTILASRHFGASGSGYINYYVSLYTFLAIFFTAGMDTSLGYFFSSEKLAKKKLYHFAFIWLVAIHVMAFAFCFLQLIFVTHDIIPGNAWFFLLFVTGISTAGIVTSLLNAEGRLFQYNVIQSLGFLVLFFILLRYHLENIPVSPELFLGWLGVSGYSTAIIIAGLFFISRQPLTSVKIFPAEKKILLKFAFIFLVTSLLNLLLTRVDYWFVKRSCTVADLGNYIQASRFGQIAVLLPGMVSFALFPEAVKNARNNTANIQLLAKLYFYGAIVFCVVFMLSGYLVFPFLFGDSFGKMPALFILSSPGIIFLTMSYPYAIYFPAIQRIKILIVALSTTIGVLSVVYSILIAQHDIYLFTIACSCGYILYASILLFVFCKSNHVKPVTLFFFNRDEMERISRNYIKLKTSLTT
jgi:O-antigen/teichoic acid export membrane protein